MHRCKAQVQGGTNNTGAVAPPPSAPPFVLPLVGVGSVQATLEKNQSKHCSLSLGLGHPRFSLLTAHQADVSREVKVRVFVCLFFILKMSGAGPGGPWVTWPRDGASITKAPVSLLHVPGQHKRQRETAPPQINPTSTRRGEENKSLTGIYKYSLG